MKKCILIFLLELTATVYMKSRRSAIKMTPLSSSRNNPNFIRDRLKNLINKPEMPPTWTNRHRQMFNPVWMDYCDPYHCNDYHKLACGLNRRKMKFKWFQSACHLILNNKCSNYRGFLKFDPIETKYCHAYVMFLRAGCPTECHDEVDPICGMSSIDGHVVMFKNRCSMELVNCRNSTLQEYDEVYMSTCEYELIRSVIDY